MNLDKMAHYKVQKISIKSLSTIAPIAVQIDLVTIESVFPIKQISVPTFINKIWRISWYESVLDCVADFPRAKLMSAA
jgi:hypothetical protein